VITVQLTRRPEFDGNTDDVETFDRMMTFFYRQDYGTSDGPDDTLPVHAKVYAIAEKHGVANLKELAKQYYIASLVRYWRVSDMARAIMVVNKSVPAQIDGLKQITAFTVAKHLARLIENNDIVGVLAANPDFSIRVTRAMNSMGVLPKLCADHNNVLPCLQCGHVACHQCYEED